MAQDEHIRDHLKFNPAEWGSRGREFDSRHSDQTVGCASAKERQIREGLAFFIYVSLGAVLCSSNGFLTDIIFPVGNIMRKKD